jgi:Secretion system C-terminal sorting domain
MKQSIMALLCLFYILPYSFSQSNTEPNTLIGDVGVQTITQGTSFTGRVADFSNESPDEVDLWKIPDNTGGSKTFTFTVVPPDDDFGSIIVTVIECSDASRTPATYTGTTFVMDAKIKTFNLDATKFYIVSIQEDCIECAALYDLKMTDAALPVKLISFNATSMDKKINLSWSTASEENSAYFDIERSSNAKVFEKIGKIEATGNSKTLINYQFSDNSSKYALNYYRLKQVDNDGRFQYSPTIAVTGEKNSLTSLYPNPASDKVFILTKNNERLEKITIFNALGQRAFTDKKDANVLEINHLPKGYYIVEIVTENGDSDKKLLIKH